MNLRHWSNGCALIAAAGMFGILGTLSAEPPQIASEQQAQASPVPAAPAVVSARERAKVMHSVYAATLEVMHERYFHGERAMVPARALEDVFAEVATQSKIKARWISVNTKAMSIQHEPKSDFEKQAAKEIAAGKDEFELLEEGYYKRAAPIPLSAGCVNCHTGFFAGEPKSPRFAGLVISIPIEE